MLDWRHKFEEQACLSSDDHVIKLCHTALCEYREYGDGRYLRAAARKLGFVP